MNTLHVSRSKTERETRTLQIVQDDLRAARTRASTIFAWLMIAQWIGAVVVALAITPHTWVGARAEIHKHVWGSLIVGMVLTSLPVLLAVHRPADRVTRHIIAAAQMLFSSLLIHVTGGRIETHFHVFGSLAFLAFFRDWQVLVNATLVITADHFLRGIYLPISVFGTAAASQWRWAEHAAWVIFEDAVLLVAHAQTMKEMHRAAADRAALESARDAVESEVVARTAELERTAEALRRSEEETRAAMEAAEAASRAKSSFLANMSHEIRTPMSAILGYSDLLDEPGQKPEELRLATARIRANAHHLLGIIDDILDLSKIEAGTMRVELSPCDPRRICEEVADVLRPRALAKGLTLRLDIPEMPTVLSDPLRLRQILMNLVGNAVKFAADGEVLLAADYHQTPAGATLSFRVRDDGIGMSAEQLATLFRPFTQADNSMSRRFGGTGLGLFISRRLATMLGGEIHVRSEAGRGSEFTLRLTAAPARPAPAPIEAPAGDQLPELRGRILLAEDGPDNQRLISMMLRRAGADVTVVADGRRAVEAATASLHDERPFDLVLMDMQMPEMDGYTAAATLRRQGWDHPIIALTAHAMVGDRERCLEAGCDDYLAKPVKKVALLNACARWMVAPTRSLM